MSSNTLDDSDLRDLVLVDATVVDGVQNHPAADRGLWLRAGRIHAIGPSDDVLAAARADGVERLWDAGGDYVMAGLINMHVHFGLMLPGQMTARLGSATDAELALHMADGARRTLQCGVTTVRLTGETGHVDFALRAAIDRGAATGPRVFTAGEALCCTGGHGHSSGGREADGVSGFRRAVREQVRAGADLIKVCISGGIAGEYEAIDTPQLTEDEMAAVIGVAHDWGRKVTAHAGPAEAISRAVSLGLDCVEHGYQLTDDVCALMAERGTWYVPTIVVSRCEEFFRRHGVPAWMVERALGAGDRHWQSLQSALAHGVPIALGSDMPPFEEYDETNATVRELEFMAEAGMDALDALRAATIAPARWLGAEDRLGTVEQGKAADLVVLRDDPTMSVSALRTVRAVVKAGRVVRDDLARVTRLS